MPLGTTFGISGQTLLFCTPTFTLSRSNRIHETREVWIGVLPVSENLLNIRRDSVDTPNELRTAH
jgi:hypothetical protein